MARKIDPQDIVGKSYGIFKVLSYLLRTPYAIGVRRGYIHTYLCECSCGGKVQVTRTNLFNGRPKFCVCEERARADRHLRPKSKPLGNRSPKWRGYGEIRSGFWTRVRNNARNRGIGFHISIQEAWDLFLGAGRQCALTGVPLVFGRGSTDTTASLDRIDSLGCYELSNLQWVHKDINRMKWEFSNEKFLHLCKSVIEHSKRK